ncbi:radical SAM protein [bacterium]|nr:radical SAM protein [bacterium]RQV98955.1 MAG: radical SAM protein [bacterium]
MDIESGTFELKDENQLKLDLNRGIKVFFRDALRIALRNPKQAISFLRTLRWLRRSARLRSAWVKQGVQVPPIIIFSVTNECNLKCQGCYAQSFHQKTDHELSDDEVRNIVEQSKELGVSFFVIAGGEPFLRSKILDIMKDFPEMIFLVFTNGVLIDNDMIDQFKKYKNVVPLISLEGDGLDTDRRRGEGTYKKIENIMAQMDKKGIFFGTSLTLTRQSFSTIMNRSYIQNLIKAGSKFLLYIDYTPTQEGTEDWVLTDEQRNKVMDLMKFFRLNYPALFIAVPWDEVDVGGCLSAGRGFIHINAEGDVEPCPFAPFSDINLKYVSLKEALRSEFLSALRQIPELSRYTGGGCALWKNREKVVSVLRQSSNHKK